MTPTISVVMAVYNGQAYLAAAIESILQQTWQDFEFIILNDASTDGSASILAQYADQDKRIRLLENPQNLGLTRSLNRGLALAKGKYIARQDADDLSLPARFAKQIHYLESHPQTVLLSSNAEIINADGQKIGELKRALPPEVVKYLLKFYNHVGAHSAAMFRHGLASYDESRRYSQDYELWLRLSQMGEIAILPETLLKLRQHAENISHLHQQEQSRQSLADALAAWEGKISQAELELLLRFWLEPFPSPSHAPQVHQILKRLPAEHPQIQAYIRQRWQAWLGSVSLRRQPFSKIRLALYSRM